MIPRVIPASEARRYCLRIPSFSGAFYVTVDGLNRTTAFEARDSRRPWDEAMVAEVLRELNDQYDMWFIGEDYKIVLLPYQLAFVDIRSRTIDGWIDGERLPGVIFLSPPSPTVSPSASRETLRSVLSNLLGHELMHELHRYLDKTDDNSHPAEVHALASLYGLDLSRYDDRHAWEQRPREMFAELLSYTVWSCPIDPRFTWAFEQSPNFRYANRDDVIAWIESLRPRTPRPADGRCSRPSLSAPVRTNGHIWII